ncbi:hypothetical protein [Aureivirga marina]|uniref:hypothetical protein n=1 Tax=Aureivirga marina TaxID=1182451 RepID=UPI0018CB7076|nr:hypothetical protein [Aureivirga marina]
MSKIKVVINAFGFPENEEGKEFLQDYFLEKDHTSANLNRNDFEIILKFLIQKIKDLKQFYAKESNDENGLDSFKFQIEFKEIFEEKNFFTKVTEFENLHDLVLKYCDVLKHGEENSRIWILDSFDEAPPAGTFAILALVNKEKSWISEYIKFLRTNDLEHEVAQFWDIKSILEKYGWNTETCRLAIARNVSCCGQVGREQFSQFLEKGLKIYLNKKENKTMFLKLIKEEFDIWEKVDFRIKDGSSKYFKTYVLDYVSHFKEILEEEELKEINDFLIQKWEDFHDVSFV